MHPKFHLRYLVRYLGIALVAGLSFGLRFWQLGRFNHLVFDEVYYVKFAQDYLAGEAVFDAHPPMGKYAIAAGIWLYEHIPWHALTAQSITAEVNLSPVSYRWMNALVGALVPLVVVGLAHSLTTVRKASQDWAFGILAGTFVAIDGLFITESRYGLLNIYVVLFGLLGHWLWIAARRERRRPVELVMRGLSGVSLGVAIATKWNGLGYVLALVIWESWQQLRNKSHKLSTTMSSTMSAQSDETIWRRSLLPGIICLGLLPLLTYSLLWWPHIRLNEDSFLSIHHTLFLFHQNLEDVQVACSQWFTWPLLIKPIAYWYEKVGAQGNEQAYTVNNLGNPALWWLSGASVVLVAVERLSQLRLSNHQNHNDQNDVPVYLLIGYSANWLPWILVTRCTYNYLHMPAAVFGFMLFAQLMSRWLAVDTPVSSRWFGFFMLGAIALAFFFWLPLSLGLPLSPEQLQMRWWLSSWI